MKMRLLAVLMAFFFVVPGAPGAEPPSEKEEGATEAKTPPEEGKEEPKPPEPPEGLDDLEALLKEVEDLYRAESSHSRVEMTVTTPRRTRTLAMEMWTEGDEKALIVIESPAREKGIATLKVERNLWNYLPRIKRTIRIPPSMMMGSWMGSDFTNDDLVQESSLRKDYTYALGGWSRDPEGWVVRLEAKPDVVGLWKSIEFVVTLDPVLPVAARYYDRKDRLARTVTWSEVEEFGDKKVPALMTLVPVDEKKEGHKTEMRYKEIEFDAEVPEGTFSLSRLERQR